jgi:ceramide glucosyltransferase
MTTKQHVTRAEFKALVCSIGLAWYLGIWVIGLLGVRTAFVTLFRLIPELNHPISRRYRNRPRSPVSSAVSSTIPGVSILRPLKGLDTNLYENLESTFQQEYSNFEILLSVADPNDQALPVVRDFISK